MRKWIAILIMILVSVNFYFSIKRLKPVSQEKKEIGQILNEMEEEIRTEYPDDPTQVITLHNTLMDALYGDQVTQEQVQQIIQIQRTLYDSEFLELTTGEKQLEDVTRELLMIKEQNLKIISSNIMNSYEEPPEVVKVEVAHYTNQTDIIRLYMLRKETVEGPQKDTWKIYGWKDINTSDI